MSEKRTIKWVPGGFKRDAVPGKPAEGDQPAVEAIPEKVLYEGHLIVEVPLSEDRCELLLELGSEDPEDPNESEKQQNVHTARQGLDIYRRYAKKLLVGCEVTRVRDGKKLSLEEVLCEPALVNLPIQLGWKYIAGFGPGNE